MYPRTVIAVFRRRFAWALASLGGIALTPDIAFAHFILQEPPAAFAQNGLGDPQKTGPCGDGGSGTPTGEVTVVQSGDMLTVTINETIPHPGHYRIAIAQDPTQLPAPPEVTQVGNDQCGSVPIDPAPALPVLADGVFAHDEGFGGVPQTIEIPIPSDFSCDNCTLQVIEYMREHGAPCFYYHCATVSVEGSASSDSTTSPDETGSSTGDGESGSTSSEPMGTTNSTNGNTSNGSSPQETTSGSGDESGTGAVTTPVEEPAMTDEGCGCSQSGPAKRAKREGSVGFLLGLLSIVGLSARRRRRP